MSAVTHLALTLCYLSVAVTVISLFLPQKRTRKIFSFVIGLFVICSLISCIRNTTVAFEEFRLDDDGLTATDFGDYTDAVKQETADNLVASIDEFLRSEGIEAKDIQLSLKISDKGRIYVEDVIIYISKADIQKKQDVERIINRNLFKEPQIYVEE